MKKPYIIGICGGSGSGKTYLVKKILAKFPESAVTFISQDNYYRPYEEQDQDENGLVNFDHPESVMLDVMEADIKKILSGETITMKEYTFNNPQASAKTVVYKPAPILLLEGLFIYHHDSMDALFDLRVFMEAEEHIRLARRLYRDRDERGYGMDSVLRDYQRFVAPMYEKFVAPARKKCDFIVPNNNHVEKALEVIVDHLKAKM